MANPNDDQGEASLKLYDQSKSVICGDHDSAFHPVFVDKNIAENQLLDFDLRNLSHLKTDRHIEVGNALHKHYVDSIKQIQVAFGQQTTTLFDFQHYNWGFCLCIEENAHMTDKIQALLSFYSSHIQNRLDSKEFEIIIKRHSDYKLIEDAHTKKVKWADLIASFRLHASRKNKSVPQTIGAKHLEIILNANKLIISIDVDSLMKRLARLDKIGKKLFGCVADDPLLKGQTSVINLKI